MTLTLAGCGHHIPAHYPAQTDCVPRASQPRGCGTLRQTHAQLLGGGSHFARSEPQPCSRVGRTPRRCGPHEEQRLDAEFPGEGLGGRARRCCRDPLPPRTHADSREPAPLSGGVPALPPPDRHQKLTGTTLCSSLLGSRGRGHLGGLDEDLHDVTCREKKSSARELPLAAEVKVAF